MLYSLNLLAILKSYNQFWHLTPQSCTNF